MLDFSVHVQVFILSVCGDNVCTWCIGGKDNLFGALDLHGDCDKWVIIVVILAFLRDVDLWIIM
jgi:hypothetical protein